jgi:hypothetical protein
LAGFIDSEALMTKMDMVWIAVAGLLHPSTASSRTVTRAEIESEVSRLFRVSLTRVMIDKHRQL